MHKTYRRTVAYIAMIRTSTVYARTYPIKQVTINNCIPTEQICTMDLPIIQNADYQQYKNNYIYRRIYTVLRGATYKGQRDSGQGSHKGVDIASIPTTPVYSIQSGQVVQAGRGGNRGNVVVIKHHYQESYIYSSYAHLQTIFVKQGDIVDREQKIGEIGDTGNTSGPHLHFQIDTNQNGVYPFHFYNCAGSLADIVNQGLCRNQLLTNTIDPIAFLEQQRQNTTTQSTIQLSNFIGGYSPLHTLQLINIQQTNPNNDRDTITIQYDASKVWVFPTTLNFVGSQRTIYARGIQTGMTMIELIQNNKIIHRIPIIVGENQSIEKDNQTIVDIFNTLQARY